MAFVKRNVKDRVVQYPRRYQLVEVQPGIFDLIPVTGTVTEEGTPINKAYLQPIEDGLENALEKTGDGKDVIVTFSEASTEAHISSGEKLSTLFGKILKKFKSVAPKSHASSANTYGVGTTANFGHVKTINNLTQASHVNGNALSAYQGKLLKDLIDIANPAPVIYKGTASAGIVTVCTFDITKYSKIFLTATQGAIYDIITPNLIAGIRISTSSSPDILTYNISSTPLEITHSGTTNTHYRFLLSVSGNTATLELKGGSKATGAYEAILY